MRCTRLVIADRHPIVLHGLTSVFATQRGFEIVASCGDGASCVEAIRNLVPDVAIVDDALPDLTWSEILAIAVAENLSTRLRSEERRVGKECRARVASEQQQ